MEVQVFGVKKSAGTRAALRFFAERRIKVHFVDLNERAAAVGGVVVIQDGGVVIRRAFGRADLERRVPATPETDYRLASMSKQFTAMTVMLLARDGKLRYDQQVRDFLPELPAAAQSVTIR